MKFNLLRAYLDFIKYRNVVGAIMEVVTYNGDSKLNTSEFKLKKDFEQKDLRTFHDSLKAFKPGGTSVVVNFKVDERLSAKTVKTINRSKSFNLVP